MQDCPVQCTTRTGTTCKHTHKFDTAVARAGQYLLRQSSTHTFTVPLKITMKFLTTRSLHQCQKFLSVTNLQLVIQGNHENKYFIKSGPTSRRPLELRMREGQSLSSIKMKLIKTAKNIIITKALCLLI